MIQKYFDDEIGRFEGSWSPYWAGKLHNIYASNQRGQKRPSFYETLLLFILNVIIYS